MRRPGLLAGCGAWLLLVCLALPAAGAEPLFGRTVASVAFRSALAGISLRATEQELRALITTLPGGTLTPATVRSDIEALFRTGYFDDVVIDAAEAGDGGADVVYLLTEKPVVREIAIEGNDEIDEEDIREVVSIKPFSIVNRGRIQKNIEKIRDLYIDKGYLLTEVGHRLDMREKNEATLVFTISENAKVTVRRIAFAGNENIPAAELRQFLETGEGTVWSFLSSSGTFKAEAVERDAARIEQYYGMKGYVEAKVDEPVVAIDRTLRDVYVTHRVTEGPRFTLGETAFEEEGGLLVPEEELRGLMKVRKGDIFNKLEFMQDIQRLTDRYADLGYAYANVSPLSRADREKRILDITFQIERGRLVTVERINIGGNLKTRDKVIRRELRLHEGDLYSATKLRESRARAYRLGFFDDVTIATAPGSADDRIVLNVEVKERRTGSFQIGMGFSSLENYLFTAQISQNNLLGRGQTLMFSAQLSSMRKMFDLRFYEPYFLDSLWSFSFNAFNRDVFYRSQGSFEGYSRNSYGADITFGHPILLEDLRLYATYTLEDVSMNIEDSPAVHLFQSGLTSSLALMLKYDTRDNYMFPTSGQMHSLSVEYSNDWTGSDIEFTKYSFESQFYIPVFWKFVLKLNADLGFVTSNEEPDPWNPDSSDFPGVPVAERFLLGGIYSVRGYEFGSLSPSIEVMLPGDPAEYARLYRIGGNKKAVFNIELEFPIVEQAQIKGVLFFDAGNTWSEQENWFYINQQDRNRYDLPLGLFLSCGFGFRWYSPIGPLRFEWGIPLTPRPEDPGIGFEFSIGNPF